MRTVVTHLSIIHRLQKRPGVGALNAEGNVKLDKLAVPFTFTEKSERSGFEHSYNLPEIGLYPESAGLVDPLSFIKSHANDLASQIAERVGNAWYERFCKGAQREGSISFSGEQVHRCLRGKPSETPVFVSKWYENHLGVSFQDAQSILNLKDF